MRERVNPLGSDLEGRTRSLSGGCLLKSNSTP